jgi:hypothetical protein
MAPEYPEIVAATWDRRQTGIWPSCASSARCASVCHPFVARVDFVKRYPKSLR